MNNNNCTTCQPIEFFRGERRDGRLPGGPVPGGGRPTRVPPPDPMPRVPVPGGGGPPWGPPPPAPPTPRSDNRQGHHHRPRSPRRSRPRSPEIQRHGRRNHPGFKNYPRHPGRAFNRNIWPYVPFGYDGWYGPYDYYNNPSTVYNQTYNYYSDNSVSQNVIDEEEENINNDEIDKEPVLYVTDPAFVQSLK